MEQVKSSKEVGQVGTHAPEGTHLTEAAQKDYLGNLKHQLCLLPAKNKEERLGALNIFKSGECNIPVCSDVGSRGLDIPFVDTVINYTIPPNSKDYIHWVARTKFSVLLVNQYEVVWYMDIENRHIGKTR